jgi:hypothetical protein
MKLKYIAISTLALAMLVLTVIPALAKEHKNVGFGELYYEGEIVRTVVPPAASPQEGKDYPLTSATAVLTAAVSGDITITRMPEADFKCPIQP